MLGIESEAGLDLAAPLEELHLRFAIDAGDAVEAELFDVVGGFDAERFEHRDVRRGDVGDFSGIRSRIEKPRR